jgi:hypothetical protein
MGESLGYWSPFPFGIVNLHRWRDLLGSRQVC